MRNLSTWYLLFIWGLIIICPSLERFRDWDEASWQLLGEREEHKGKERKGKNMLFYFEGYLLSITACFLSVGVMNRWASVD
jgi:hypothetical protein